VKKAAAILRQLLRIVKKPRRVSPPQWRNQIKYVFWRDMCVPENTSRPVSVPEGRAQQAANPHFRLAEKACLFLVGENL
jgi:hypothetical protein